MTFQHCLDMKTGNYESSQYQQDENFNMVPFFEKETYAGKIEESFKYVVVLRVGSCFADAYLSAVLECIRSGLPPFSVLYIIKWIEGGAQSEVSPSECVHLFSPGFHATRVHTPIVP